jgi:hypothetical protein
MYRYLNDFLFISQYSFSGSDCIGSNELEGDHEEPMYKD